MADLKKVVFVLWSEDGGIFVPASDYQSDVQIEGALENAKTWREFKGLMPELEFQQLGQWECNGGENIFEEDGRYYFLAEGQQAESFITELGEENVIHADNEFSAKDVWGFGDGDYPGMHYHTCDKVFPESFRKKYGNPVASMVAGSWAEYPIEKLEDMKAQLGALGIDLFEDLSMDPTYSCLPDGMELKH